MLLLVVLTLAVQLIACAARTTVASQAPNTTQNSTDPSFIINTTSSNSVTKTTVTSKTIISLQDNVTSETTVTLNTSTAPSTGLTTGTLAITTPSSSNITTLITGTKIGSNSTTPNPKELSVISNASSSTTGSNTTTSIANEPSVIPNTTSTINSNTTTSKPTETSVIPNTTSSTISSNTNISNEQAPKSINTSLEEYKPPSGDIWDSAFFTCGSKIYGNDSISAGILFPPSDANMPNISSATEGEDVFNKTYNTFCGKLPAYTSCVKETVKSETEMDSRLKMYINMDNVDKAFAVYCNNNASITSHIQCTIKAVERYSCPFGGIFGLLEFVTNALQIGLPKDQYCTGLKESIRCRVDQQLRNCSTSYAETMETVYTALMGKFCLL